MEWLQQNWDQLAVSYLLFHKFLVSIRDTLDKTPDTDDNVFERFVTATGKVTGYLISGKRPYVKPEVPQAPNS